jgi:hypothetical protein
MSRNSTHRDTSEHEPFRRNPNHPRFRIDPAEQIDRFDRHQFRNTRLSDFETDEDDN